MAEETNKTDKKKKKKGSSVLFYIVIIALIAIAAFSAYKVISIQHEYNVARRAYDDIADAANATIPEQTADPTDDEYEFLDLDWDAIKAESPNAVAWLKCNGTVINYPVALGTDNEFYLTHLVNGDWSGSGSLFVDYRQTEPFKGSFNTIIYGHRMRNGTMFSCLGKYFFEEGYWENNKCMELYTPNGDYIVEIFAAIYADANDGYVYKLDWENEDASARQEFLDYISSNNSMLGYDGSVSVTPDDHIIMMSTCQHSTGDARLLVFGKLVPRTETTGTN